MAIEVGSVLEGVVSGITEFGAFIELPEGKVGLVHISEVADEFVKDIKDFLKEKDTVKVKVLSVDERGKIGLSIKRLQEKQEEPHPRKSFAPRPQPKEGQETDGVPASYRRSAPAFRQNGDFRRQARFAPGSASFEDKISKFMKDSEEILRDSSRRTDSKRGGRGGRRR